MTIDLFVFHPLLMYHKLTIKLNNTCKGYSQIQFELADMVQHSTIFSFRDFRKKIYALQKTSRNSNTFAD
jgi:hypothetical protein